MFGAIKAGLVVVNTNPLYTPREMKHQFKDSGASAIVILANFAHNLEEILAETAIKTVVVTEIGDMLGGFKGILINWVVKNIKKMVPKYKIKGAVKFNQAMSIGASAAYSRPQVEGVILPFFNIPVVPQEFPKGPCCYIGI